MLECNCVPNVRMFKNANTGMNYHNKENICEGDNIIITQCGFFGDKMKGKIEGKVKFFNHRACFGIKTSVEHGLHLALDNIPFEYYHIDKK